MVTYLIFFSTPPTQRPAAIYDWSNGWDGSDNNDHEKN